MEQLSAPWRHIINLIFHLFKLWKFGLVNLLFFAIGNFELPEFIRTNPAFLLCTFIGFDFRLFLLFLHRDLTASLLLSNV